MRINIKLLTLFVTLGLIISCLLIMAGCYLLVSSYANRFLPNTYIDNLPVGGLSIAEAEDKLKSQLVLPSSSVIVRVEEISISSSSSDLEVTADINNSIKTAYGIGRSGNAWQRTVAILKTLIYKTNIATSYYFNVEKIKELLTQLTLQADVAGHDPLLSLKTSGVKNSLTTDYGQVGRQLDWEKTTKSIQSIASQSGEQTIAAAIVSTNYVVSPLEMEASEKLANNIIGKSLSVFHNVASMSFSDQELISFIKPNKGFDEEKISSLIKLKAEKINAPATNAVLEYDPSTLKVNRFQPHKPGIEVNNDETTANVIFTLQNWPTNHESSVVKTDLVVNLTDPEITLASTNDLGINELIGVGESEYAHSIPNRIHNVAITTSRVSGTIVPPGQEFSFNKALGEVSARTGFRPAYVIANGRTELGDGGGVCQVSSTLFRAVLNSGLKITRRLQHSYRVTYYELNSDPGFDATVYAGETDFRFVNDTQHHILVFGEADSENTYMRMEIYGTSDGRKSEILNYRKWGASSALPTEYFDDPSLPAGNLRQVDWAAGGIRTSFDRKVTAADGNILYEDTFTSNYRPWSAKFLRGTGPAR